jgi:transcriptional regulator with XRE-family HTH domain
LKGCEKMTDYEKKVRIAMIEKGIKTFSELADNLGVSVSYISDVLKENRKAIELRQKINEFLGLDGE